MQSALSRIWIRVAVFISYYDNHYTTIPALADGFQQESELPQVSLGSS